MNGKTPPQFAVFVPDNSCTLALIEPFFPSLPLAFKRSVLTLRAKAGAEG